MQKVSQAYKTSMKSSLRERGYIMISFGLVNQEAQANATLDNDDFTYFSNTSTIFSDRNDSPTYATLETNFTKVDGSFYFLPAKTGSQTYLDTGIVSDETIVNGTYDVNIKLNVIATDIKGLTIKFGDNYPVRFDIITDTGYALEIRDNTEKNFVTEEVFEGVTALTLRFYKMRYTVNRLRIYSIQFGYGLTYYNDSVMESSLESYVSPIGSDVPQIDFTVKLKNYDHYFNVDNPDSAINYLETGQQMEVWYGYQLPDDGGIEWIKGNHLLCAEWESDDSTATIKCQDVFRNMTGEYYKGSYIATGKSYYDLAVEILTDAGEDDYSIDPRLKRLYSKNPIPKVTHREALQIIANACRCTLSQTRDGTIQIKSNFVPESTMIMNNGEETYSNYKNITDDCTKDEYATLATDYTPVDGTTFFLPSNGVSSLNTGYISRGISGIDCKITPIPSFTIKLDALCKFYGLKLIFGNSLPGSIRIVTYNNERDDEVERYDITDGITKEMIISHEFEEFDEMLIQFPSTSEPYQRIVVNYLSLGDITDFTMTRRDMTSSPTAIKQEQVKEIIVPCYSYQYNSTVDDLISEDVEAVAGISETFYIGEASYGFTAKLNDSTDNVTITDYGNYFITVKYNVTGNYRLDIEGHKYQITERYSKITLRTRGATVKWENPLISDMTMAADLAEWLADYYSAGVEYEYDTRGNPEIDADDVVYQENEFIDNMKVNIYRHTIGFNQAFSGHVVARRVIT